MKPMEYLGDCLWGILLHLVAAVSLSVFLLLTGTSRGVVFLILVVWALGLSLRLLTGYLRANARIRELEALLEGLDQRHLFAEITPAAKSRYERRLFSLMRRSGKSMIEAVSDAEEQQRQYREYIESWVHEIKAPITAAQLVCRNNPSEPTRKINTQLALIEGHVERALYYARSSGMEQDLVVRHTPLREIVQDAISRYQVLLIQNNVRIETDGLDQAVYTDGKWAAFLLGQLLSNAVRYGRDNPVIQIKAASQDASVRLSVTDNGIGIPAHDLPRVFQRGFTGSNGRSRGGSTGMGLYLCQKVAAHLQVELAIRSVEGESTTVSLIFPGRENLTKL